MTESKHLTFEQLDGQACVVCGENFRPMIPLGLETSTSTEVFRCDFGEQHRGQAMTLPGLRSLFRHHRLRSQVLHANPHRFRHTFGATMVRAGISLPALQQLMGHSQIRTTMLYVQLAPQDVWREYARAVHNRNRLSIPQNL